MICTHEHAPLHGWVALQRPLQTPTTPGCLCNCRAETVPAKRTPMTSALKSVVLIFLSMVVPFLFRAAPADRHQVLLNCLTEGLPVWLQ